MILRRVPMAVRPVQVRDLPLAGNQAGQTDDRVLIVEQPPPHDHYTVAMPDLIPVAELFRVIGQLICIVSQFASCDAVLPNTGIQRVGSKQTANRGEETLGERGTSLGLSDE